MSVTVPDGLSELLEEFAVTVLNEKPKDLLEFAARYFNDLNMSRQQSGDIVSEKASTATAAEVEMRAEGWWHLFYFLSCFQKKLTPRAWKAMPLVTKNVLIYFLYCCLYWVGLRCRPPVENNPVAEEMIAEERNDFGGVMAALTACIIFT